MSLLTGSMPRWIQYEELQKSGNKKICRKQNKVIPAFYRFCILFCLPEELPATGRIVTLLAGGHHRAMAGPKEGAHDEQNDQEEVGKSFVAHSFSLSSAASFFNRLFSFDLAKDLRERSRCLARLSSRLIPGWSLLCLPMGYLTSLYMGNLIKK